MADRRDIDIDEPDVLDDEEEIFPSGPAEKLELPSIEESYKQILLTNHNIWNEKFTKNQIESWLDNFTGEVLENEYEKQLALWLLANFVYYNDDEVRHLCKMLFNDLIHNRFKESGTCYDIDRFIKIYSGKVKFAPLGNPSESGSYVLYFFRQINQLPKTFFFQPPIDLPNETAEIGLIDDVTISGSQARRYIEQVKKKYPDNKISLLTFISTEEAAALLDEIDIDVISCIKLDDRDRCFSDKSHVFRRFESHKDDCKRMAIYYGSNLFEGPLGYMNGEYLFGFSYNTPDNTLPIFWGESGGWTPLMTRYHKIYSGKGFDKFGHFI